MGLLPAPRPEQDERVSRMFVAGGSAQAGLVLKHLKNEHLPALAPQVGVAFGTAQAAL